jgi:hypothetical protein
MIWHQRPLCSMYDVVQSQSYITTDSQSASPSWCQASIWDPQPIFPILSDYFFRLFWVWWCGLPLWQEVGSVFFSCCRASPVQPFSDLIPMGLMTIVSFHLLWSLWYCSVVTFCWLPWNKINKPLLSNRHLPNVTLFLFSNLFASCRDTFSKWCDGRRCRVEECSVAPLLNKRVKTLCGCREEGAQTKEYYKLRLSN